MLKFLEATAIAAVAAAALCGGAVAQDAGAGKRTFAKCAACHAVGPGARHRVGPELNDLIGRTAGSIEGYRYSPAMTKAGQGGLVWTAETLQSYLADPKAVVPGTKMTFAGLKKADELANIVAYLGTFATTAAAPPSAAEATPPLAAPAAAATPGAATPGAGHVLRLGRQATPEEIAAWDIDIRPDGLGLPKGKGTVAQGGEIYEAKCAACHGGFGESVGRWPVLAGGQDTLQNDRPEKTIGSYWPFLSTVYDYVRRAMPFGDARSLSDDDVYALTAYLLYLNDIVTDENFVLSDENFTAVKMPNAANFIDDDRAQEAHYHTGAAPCMTACRPGTATIKTHAAVLDVTPEEGGDDRQPAAGIQ